MRRSAITMAFVFALASAHPDGGPAERARELSYRVEEGFEFAGDLMARFTAAQLATLEKLNRADLRQLPRLPRLVVPSRWEDDELRYSPFPSWYAPARGTAKLVVVDLASQAFGAYERGHLVRWGPVSSGRRTAPTPSGLFHLTWRSRARSSTVNPAWRMEWYFNFDNVNGLALHQYTLPGYPASHACVRLLERDAVWMYDWADTWTVGAGGQVVAPGTPLLIVGRYDYGAPPPWRSRDGVARPVALPPDPGLPHAAG